MRLIRRSRGANGASPFDKRITSGGSGNQYADFFQAAEFVLPLSDAGAGAVNLALGRGVGPATFTRATAAATRLSTGLWKIDVASGTARSHYYEFAAGVYTYGGYLAEPAATQLCLDPRDMTTANWTLGATMTRARTSAGIDGAANTATRLTGGAVAATNRISQTLTAAASSRTVSFFIKRITGTGPVRLTQDGFGTTLDIAALLNTTSYVQVELNQSQLNAVFGIQIDTSTDAIDVDCAQFEAGGVSTTPIPAAGTRNADVLTYVYAGNADISQGSTYAELATLCMVAAAPVNQVAVCVGAGGRALFVAAAGAYTTMSAFDTTNTAAKTGLTSLATGIRKRAASWGAPRMVVTGDGASVASAAFDGAMGTTANVSIANTGGGEQIAGTVKNVRIAAVQPGNDVIELATK